VARNDVKSGLLIAAITLSAIGTAHSQTQVLSPDQAMLREIYKELIEINTTDSAGDTTAAAQAMAARLRSGGFAAGDMQLVVPPGGPKKGNLVARLVGSGAARPMLLLAHLDVVEARREDWQRDPFKLIEKDGYFYARGAIDDKAMAAGLVAAMIRLKREGWKPARDIILALTADEELVPSRFNGVQYLLDHHRKQIDAEFALNEGGGGLINREGKYLYHGVQAGEKVFQTFRLEVENPGGHSSRPSKDNAIYHLADGLSRLGKFDFPFKLSAITRGYFERLAAIEQGPLAQDYKNILRDSPDPQALARITQSPNLNALVRTTCVATMLEAGHAKNALPQRARAIVNCRILPGEPPSVVQETLVRVLADDKIRVVPEHEAMASPPSPLTEKIMKPVEAVSAELWPGVPVIPVLMVGATDGRLLNNAGIPTYGITGGFRDVDGGGVHGLNERCRVKSLYDSAEFLYRLIKRLSSSG